MILSVLKAIKTKVDGLVVENSIIIVSTIVCCIVCIYTHFVTPNNIVMSGLKDQDKKTPKLVGVELPIIYVHVCMCICVYVI